MAKRFKKVYLVLEDNEIFSKYQYQTIDLYRRKEDADRMCGIKQQKAVEESVKMWNEGKPVQKYKVHGFYLIHEGWFKEDEGEV